MESDPEARAIRAVAMQARVHPANPLTDPRSLVSAASNWRKTKGICPWCNERNSEPMALWHVRCQQYYYAARGATYYERDGKKTPLVAKTLCVMCGDLAQEISHIVPLEGARSNRGSEVVKAWTPQNLQWLCMRCHGVNTAMGMIGDWTKDTDAEPFQLNLF